jgi:hypothetical protein
VRALEELTSRKSGTDIPKILERLEAAFDKTLEAQRAAERKAGQRPSSAVPYDVNWTARIETRLRRPSGCRWCLFRGGCVARFATR